MNGTSRIMRILGLGWEFGGVRLWGLYTSGLWLARQLMSMAVLPGSDMWLVVRRIQDTCHVRVTLLTFEWQSCGDNCVS